jgi:nucleoid-associated protein YgaU
MLRTEEETLSTTTALTAADVAPRELVIPSRASSDVLVHEVTGAGDSAERLDELAQRYYGDASMWREIANANGITDPTGLVAGTLLRIPPLGGGL